MLLLLFVPLAFPSVGLAQDRIAQLIQNLRQSEDFRVRTQAALALGASGDGRAVAPLCEALSDQNTTVRAASASAMGRLAQGGADCLKKRLAIESSADVKSVIRRALERLGDERPEGIQDNTRYYVAIGEITNKSARSKASANQEVRKQLQRFLMRQSGFAIAPATETPAQAKELLKKHPRVKPVFVWPKLEMNYVGGTLKVKLELSLFSYPDKSFKGSMSRNLASPDTERGDTDTENQLIEMAAEHLATALAETVSQL